LIFDFLYHSMYKLWHHFYQMKLNPISKYKLDDLKILAKECNLLVKNGSKNKTKQVLYDEINSYHLNQ